MSGKVAALLTLILITWAWAPAAQPLRGIKEETVYYEVSWNGSLSGGDAEVSLRLSNQGDAEESASICDRLWMGDPVDVRPLLGSPPPNRTLEVPGGHALCWDSLTVGGGGELEIRYGARTNLSLPAEVSISLLVDGAPAELRFVEGRPYIPVDPGDEIEVNVTLLNTLPERLTSMGPGRPPLSYNLQLSIKRNSFTEPDSDPVPVMTLPSGDRWIVSWFGVLWNEPEVVSIRFRLRSSVPLGVEDFPELTIQLSTDTSSVADQLDEAVERYNESLALLTNMSEQLREMRNSLYWLASSLEGARSALGASREGLSSLAEGLRKAAVGEEKAAAAVSQVKAQLADLLVDINSLGDVLDRAVEINQEFISKLQELLSEFNLSLSVLPGGVSGLLSSLQSQVALARSRAASTMSALTRMEDSLRNASISLSEAADETEAALDNLTILDSALESAESAARYGASTSEDAFSNITERIEEMNSSLADLMLKSKLARMNVPFMGPAELNPPGPPILDAPPELQDGGDVWIISDLSVPAYGIVSSFQVVADDGERMSLQTNHSGSWILAEFPPWWSSPGRIRVIPFWELNGTGSLLKGRGYRIVVYSKNRPAAHAEVDLLQGIPLKVRSRMVVSVDAPDLAVGLNFSAPPPSPSEIEAPLEEEGVPAVLVWMLTSLAAVGAAGFGYNKIRASRERERRRLLVELERIRGEIDLLMEEVRERLRES